MTLDYGNAIVLSRGTENPNQLATQQNLINALLQRPDFSERLYVAYPYFSLLSTTSAFSMMAPDFTSDNHKQWFVLGRSDNPLTYVSTVSGTGASNQPFVIQCVESYGQPNQVLRTTDGVVLQIQSAPTPAGNASNYTVRIMKAGAPAWDSTAYAQGDRFGVGAQIYGEGSQRGYGTIQYPDLVTNYTTIKRYARSMTGSDASAVTWLDFGDARLWIGTDSQWLYNAFMRTDGGFLYEKEKGFWDDVTNVVSGVGVYPDPQTGNPMYTGNGFEQQIANTLTTSFSISDFIESWVQDQLAKFVQNSGLAYCKVDVHTGAGGYSLFQKSMKQYIISQLRYNSEASATTRVVNIGAEITKYFINNCEITVYQNAILSDPNYNTKLFQGFPVRSYNFYGICSDMDDGIPTIQRTVRNANGNNRSMIIKEIPGMLGTGTQASNAFDGKTIEFLSEDMIRVNKPNRIFRWVFNGNN